MWDNKEIKSKIIECFGDKLTEGAFEILVPISGYLVRPKLNDDQELNGSTMLKIFYNKPIYIRPLHFEENIIQDQENGNIENDMNIDERSIGHEPIVVQEYLAPDVSFLNHEPNESEPVIDWLPTSLTQILESLSTQILESGINYFNVYREDIFNCCIRSLRRKSFCISNKIDVTFTDCTDVTENAIDAGGPKREMFRLLLTSLANNPSFSVVPVITNLLQ